jgi:hypothetical protein
MLNANNLQIRNVVCNKDTLVLGTAAAPPGGVETEVSAPSLGLPSRGAPGSPMGAYSGTTSIVGQHSKTG